MLAPFAKKPVNLTLRGITSDEQDLSVSLLRPPYLAILCLRLCQQVDLIRTVTLPHLQLFGVSEGLELRVNSFVSSMIAFLTSF